MLSVWGRCWALAGSLLLGVSVVVAWAASPSGPDPAVKTWRKWPYRVTCSQLTFDPIKAFSRPTLAERGSGPAELALREFLDSPDADDIPKRNWRLLARTAHRAEFAHGRLESDEGVSWLGFIRNGEEWAARGPWRCSPRTIRGGVAAIDWVLAPTLRPLDPSAASIVVGIHEQACTGGRNPVPHLLQPHIRYRKRSIVATLWVRPPDGPQTCPGNPFGWVRLKLPGPLGTRALYDGATYPPRRVQPGEDPRRLR